ncbi:MAG: gamma-glutamyltransferase [Planctomycetaceae bacterium]|nr:gamma-glutamyltransferase [Planctomycetaceae bacterium]
MHDPATMKIALIRVACLTACLWTLTDVGIAGDTSRAAVVAADHELASAAGVEILQQGGNVVDAAVATSFALAVVRPESCGLGGGGFMLIWNAGTQESIALDYRERAPAAATPDMFTSDGDDPAASRRGGLAVGVPGTVAGLCFALEHYGTLGRDQVLAPAIRLARDGFPIDATLRDGRSDVLQELADVRDASPRFAPLSELYFDRIEGHEQFRSPLGDVLERIAAEGPAGFYEGPVGAAIVATVREQGGVLTADDLQHVEPVVRRPLEGEFVGLTILSMPPPSSGGIALLETLGILAAYERVHPDRSLTALGHNTPEYIHLVAEALKHAFADRARFLGDADFVDVPVDGLLNPDAIARIAGQIDPHAVLSPDAYGRHSLPDDAGTSHFSIIDAAGNAVACTETINTTYGSLVVVPPYGIVLNNQMDDFTSAPGRPNAFGLVQSEANAITAGKKPLSSMTPTIAVRDGKAQYVAGASGGPRIISATLQVLLNMSRFGMTPQQAVSAARFHHQWSPDELRLEPGIAEAAATALNLKGHAVTRIAELAAAQAAARTATGVVGGSDPRKGGVPRGW